MSFQASSPITTPSRPTRSGTAIITPPTISDTQSRFETLAPYAYVYADLELSDNDAYRKQPNSYHEEAVQLFRDGYDIPEIVDAVRRHGPRSTVEMHLLHVLRICKEGTYHDDDIRRLLSQIENKHNWRMYGWLIIEMRGKLEPGETCGDGLARWLAERSLDSNNTGITGVIITPSISSDTTPRYRQRYQQPICPPLHPRPVLWHHHYPGFPLNAIRYAPADYKRDRLDDFLAGMSFEYSAYLQGITMKTLAGYIFQTLGYKWIPPNAINADDFRQLMREMRLLEKDDKFYWAMEVWGRTLKINPLVVEKELEAEARVEEEDAEVVAVVERSAGRGLRERAGAENGAMVTDGASPVTPRGKKKKQASDE